MVFYTCDELVPDLCELKQERGQVEIRGIHVTYFQFTAAAAPPTNKLPIVAIHGGPSFTHNYMLPLKQMACRGHEIVFYDQAGCGESRPTPDDFNATRDYPWLLDPAYYATVELPALLKHLQWNSGFHIVANSWGTMLSQLYALDSKDSTRQHLQSMVLSGPLSDSQKYVEAQWDQQDGSLGSLPPFIQQRIRILDGSGDYGSNEYQALDQILTGFFTVRTQPAPDCWLDAETQANMEIYTAMQGPSEFGMSGVLADFNVTGRLKEIEVPVLLSHGKYDTMRPSIVETMKEALPHAESLFLTKSGHVSMIDEPGRMNEAVADFLDRVEASLSSVSLGLSQRQSMALIPPNRPQVISSTQSTVPLSMFVVSTLMALMVGYVMGHTRGQRRNNRLEYTSISD